MGQHRRPPHPPPHTPTPQVGPDLSGLIPGDAGTNSMPSIRMLGGSYKQYQPLGLLCALTRVGQNCDPGGGQPALPPMPQV